MVLEIRVQVHKAGVKPPYPDNQIPMLLRVDAGVFQQFPVINGQADDRQARFPADIDQSTDMLQIQGTHRSWQGKIER